MKIGCCVCMTLGLVLLMEASSDTTNDLSHPIQCCFNFVNFKIPPKNIIKIEKTDSNCPKSGYVVTTPRARFCKHEDILQQS
ncbi:C-C motif chemokine 14-like [Salminus brasiliensis]|uniref:C-C motif chemokine 14-like n=1 Tax=Salminus brasiliensis TaxID=930266 RepID=UPI003B833828